MSSSTLTGREAWIAADILQDRHLAQPPPPVVRRCDNSLCPVPSLEYAIRGVNEAVTGTGLFRRGLQIEIRRCFHCLQGQQAIKQRHFEFLSDAEPISG